MAAVAHDIAPEVAEARADIRAAWRDGHDAGAKRGANAVYNSPTFEAIALELVLLRAAHAALSAESGRRERLLEAIRHQRNQAFARVIALARKLDALAPGWDREDRP